MDKKKFQVVKVTVPKIPTAEIRKVVIPGQPLPAEFKKKLTPGQRAYHGRQRIAKEKREALKLRRKAKAKADKIFMISQKELQTILDEGKKSGRIRRRPLRRQ